MPAAPRGLHRVVDPEDSGREEAEERLAVALELLHEAAGSQVSGHVGSADPMAAIADVLNDRRVHEIILSTLPRRLSRWMHLDLPSKLNGMGIPVTHVEGERAPAEIAGPGPHSGRDSGGAPPTGCGRGPTAPGERSSRRRRSGCPSPR